MKTIKIATDYSETPLGRFPEDGKFNGTRFREEFLRPELEKQDKVEVDIDGVEGYGSSFLEEAFGGLVRKGYFTPASLKHKLEITFKDSDFKMYGDLIWKYINEAKKEEGGDSA
jgi:hypothetical protein